MTVHEVLSWINCMEGPTPSATVVNQTMVVPPALTELITGIPTQLSDAILRGLSKDPAGRFPNCVALAQEILVAVPSSTTAEAETPVSQPTSRGVPGRVPCPACQAPMPVGREHAGGRVRCTNCQATSLVSMLSSNTVQLKLVEPPVPSQFHPPAIVLSGPDDGPDIDPTAATVIVEETRDRAGSGSSARRWCGVRAGSVSRRLAARVPGRGGDPSRALEPRARRFRRPAPDSEAAPPARRPSAGDGRLRPPDPAEINVAYGTEKQQWLEAATAEFEKTAGRGITVNLHGMGSMEGARAVLEGPSRSRSRSGRQPVVRIATSSNGNGEPNIRINPSSRPTTWH